MNIDEAMVYLEECEEEELPDGNSIDIIELPPERVDVISDEEEFDDEHIDNVYVADVPGNVEIDDMQQEQDDVNSDEEENEPIPSASRARKPNALELRKMCRSGIKKVQNQHALFQNSMTIPF